VSIPDALGSVQPGAAFVRAAGFSPYLGPAYSDNEIEGALTSVGLAYRKLSDDALVAEVADPREAEALRTMLEAAVRIEWQPKPDTTYRPFVYPH
jgi:hypothetical protein